MPPSNAQQLGNYIRQQREAKGLSLRALSRASGVPLVTLSQLEHGHYAQPRPDKLIALARALEIEVEDLYALVGYLVPEGLPTVGVYFRTKYGLPAEAIPELEAYVQSLTAKYDHPKHKKEEPIGRRKKT